MRLRQASARTAIGILCLLVVPATAPAYQATDAAPGKDQADDDVIIKREAIKVADPQNYKVSLQLSAVKTLDLIAPADGQIRSVNLKPGQKVAKEAEAFRLDDSRAALVLRRAKANLQAAKIEKKLAKNEDTTALADARVEAAQAEFDLAQLDVERQLVRIPFAGDIQRVHVVDGQFVRAGDRLATLADTSRLQVEVPVERPKTSPAPLVDLKIEETAVKAKIDAVLPLAPRFEPLRELADSIASAIVLIDNPEGKFHAGQTVYSGLIPLAPVTSVPVTSVTNQPDGTRKVQVLRDSIVRNVSVRVLGKVGTEAVFVSGKFQNADELIVSASRELADGTPVRAIAVASSGAPSRNGKGGASTTPAKPAAPKSQGF